MYPSAETFAGLIFDFNGVLLWDSHLQEAAWNRMALELRGEPFSASEMDLSVHGRTNNAILAYLLGRAVVGEELERLTEQKEATYRRLCLQQGDGFCLSPGAKALLERLTRLEVPRTIATASPRINLDFFFQHLDLERWFDRQLVAFDDGSLPGKPAPHIYLRAAKNLGLEPADCLVVEDALSGIEAARRAGIGRVYALGPPRRHPDLLAQAGTHSAITRLDLLETSLLAPTAVAGQGA